MTIFHFHLDLNVPQVTKKKKKDKKRRREEREVDGERDDRLDEKVAKMKEEEQGCGDGRDSV